jgi:hypothetical protein
VAADHPLVDEGDVITAGGLMHWAAHVHAAAMASLAFGYATVQSTRDWLDRA